ncbi:uncharacterized protein GGS25DRAFT_523339 [Hypoxylon fragiforme]|uniref:uncharacterized protein n=1 Tax=Hypoxylon fragiforme TaxID=63214 RepID=UPI0020C5FA1D|nr:uncharacterized protein GGS25DRAFT_523339 [Hypoxylon fragiforme]KAI2605667.1 hypothetical protein GGS25DRAFT_523339 [Hypoxylon fragiforme]
MPLDRAIRTSILGAIPVPDFLRAGAKFGEEGPVPSLDHIMVRVATLHARSSVLLHTYTTHGHAAIWAQYRAVRIIVNSIRRRALCVMSRCSAQAISVRAQEDDQHCTEGVPATQRRWLKARLKSVGNVLGDAALDTVAEQGEFIF